MAADLKRLSHIAGRWKNIDPQLYETFLKVMDQYVHEVTMAVTEAPSGEVLQAQGRAQQAIKFMRLFSENLETNTTFT